MQVRYIMKRYWDRMRGDIIVPLSTVAGNIAMALILSSVFYNLQPNSSSFYYRTSVMYYALLFNAYSSVLEIYNMYEGRAIVQKHREYALYPPMADAIGSIISDFPLKLFAVFYSILYYISWSISKRARCFLFLFID